MLKNLEFNTINKLIYFFYIIKYMSEWSNQNIKTVTQASSSSTFDKLKLIHNINNDQENESVIYGENVFENKDLMQKFLAKCEEYSSMYSECRHLNIDQIYETATKCIEAIIEMNSRAGIFHVLQY